MAREEIEEVIDHMLEGMDADGAVAVLLGESDGRMQVEMDLSEGCPDCPSCGSQTELAESEDGELLYCEACNTGYIPEDEDESDEEVYEAEMDENDPACASCGSDEFETSMIEDDGDEIPVLECLSCGTVHMAVLEDD